MSDHYHCIVDRDAQLNEATQLSALILDWLMEEQIVQAERSDCVLSDRLGYRPGRNFMNATGEDENRNVMNMHYEGFRTSVTNGLDIIAHREVSLDLEDDMGRAVCNGCGTTNTNDDAWSRAVQEWYDDSGEGLLACESCGKTQRVVEWPHQPPIGFGALTFKFWNWPGISQDFVREFERRLGHRVVLIVGSL